MADEVEVKLKKEKRRRFDGELKVHVDYKENPIEGRQKRNFEKKHLKAYLRGDKVFSFGRDALGKVAWFDVKEVWEDE